MYWISIVSLVLLASPSTTLKLWTQNITGLSTNCRQDLQKVPFLSPNFSLMADASSKLPAGVAKGNIISLGNFDECLEIKEVSTKFCHASVDLDLKFLKNLGHGLLNIPVGIYICALRSCKDSELNKIFHGVLEFKDELCFTNDPKELDSLALVTITVFSLVILIALISTIYDVYLIHMGLKLKHPVFLAFSLYSNGRRLFNFNKDPQQMGCLHGIKAISIMWVMLGHEFSSYARLPMDNYLEAFQWLKTVRSQYISGATLSVDTFFTVGGFLTMYTFQGAMQKGIKFNVPLYYLHRYVRLTPALAAVALAHAGIFNYLGSGPLWYQTDSYLVKPCRNYWWSALLYIQTYVNPYEICNPPSWYLNVDMQIFLISPLFLVVMRKCSFWGNLLLGTLSLLSMASSFAIGWIYKFNGDMFGNLGNFNFYGKHYYFQIYTRITPYLFGIIFGYYVYNLKQNKKNLHLPNAINVVIWIISLVLMAVCIFSGRSLRFTEYNYLANAFFIALIKPVWSLCVCWVIFACCLDYGGLINKFLKLSIFEILSRLCYCIFLVHYSIIHMVSFTSRKAVSFSESNAFYKFCGDFMFSIVLATCLSLLFESPIITLEKLLRQKKHHSSDRSPSTKKMAIT